MIQPIDHVGFGNGPVGEVAGPTDKRRRNAIRGVAIRLIESPAPLPNSAICLGLKVPRLAGAQTIGINCDESKLERAAVGALLGTEDGIRYVWVRHQCALNLVTHRTLLLQPAGNEHLNMPRARLAPHAM
jgi:hypothetical protein